MNELYDGRINVVDTCRLRDPSSSCQDLVLIFRLEEYTTRRRWVLCTDEIGCQLIITLFVRIMIYEGICKPDEG